METVRSQVKGYLNPESQFQGPQIGIAIIFQSELPQVKLTSTVHILFVPHYLFFSFSCNAGTFFEECLEHHFKCKIVIYVFVSSYLI